MAKEVGMAAVAVGSLGAAWAAVLGVPKCPFRGSREGQSVGVARVKMEYSLGSCTNHIPVVALDRLLRFVQ